MSLQNDQYGYPYEEPKKNKPPIMTIILFLVVGVIGFFIGNSIARSSADESGEITGRETAIAELQPTISLLITANANNDLSVSQANESGEVAGRETAVAIYQPTINALETKYAITPTSQPVAVLPSQEETGRLEGLVTDQSGNPVRALTVSIRNSVETVTDDGGKFVLNNVPAGDQVLVIKPATGSGQLTQIVFIEANVTTTTNVIYDSESSRLGLLTIVSPIDGGFITPQFVRGSYRSTVYGRTDGMDQFFNQFEIWVVISSQTDGTFWIQRPPALVESSSGTWQANILLGSAAVPPANGDKWDIVAIATERDSGISEIESTPRMALLPPHISSNIVTAIIQLDE